MFGRCRCDPCKNNTAEYQNKRIYYIVYFRFLYDIALSPQYELTFLWFVQATVMVALSAVGIDTLFYACTWNIVGHLKIVQHRFTAVRLHEQTSRLSQELRAIIAYHSKIISLADCLSEVYQPIMLMQFLITSLMLCVIAYQLTLVSQRIRVASINLKAMIIFRNQFTVEPRCGVICDICDIPARHLLPVLCVLPRRIHTGGGERIISRRHVHVPLARVALLGPALYAVLSDACPKAGANSSYILLGEPTAFLIGMCNVVCLQYSYSRQFVCSCRLLVLLDLILRCSSLCPSERWSCSLYSALPDPTWYILLLTHVLYVKNILS